MIGAPRSTVRVFGAAVALGVSLFAAAVALVLRRSTYEADIETLCFAESRSGRSLDGDATEVHRWVRAHLATAQGNEFFALMRVQPIEERASLLRREASAAGVRPCPMVDAIERVSGDAERRAELQELCSGTTFPDLAAHDDDGRLDLLERWIAARPPGSSTRVLGEKLRDAPAADRPRLMREAARGLDVFSCEVARALESPAPEDASEGAQGDARAEAGPASPR